MVEIDGYMERLIGLLQAQFGGRLLFVGLQGSYLRGEARADSDIDVMVVLDSLSVEDLAAYRALLRPLEAAGKSCGFLCGQAELKRWNPLEICHLRNSTRAYFGRLEPLLPHWERADAENFVKLSLNNLYHLLCHSYVHGGPETCTAVLPEAYKAAFFILQDLYHLRHGQFLQAKRQLLHQLAGQDKRVLQRAMDMEQGGVPALLEDFSLLFAWCQEMMAGF